MNRPIPFSQPRIAAILAILLLVSITSPALAGQDKKPPTKPSNLRVTSTSTYSISLAWNPSNDNSGTFSYRVWVSYGATYTVPQNQTTFTLFVAPSSTYSFYVYAVDGSGNTSPKSNTVSATTPPDVTPPTAPVVSLVAVNPTEVALSWTASTDDGPYLFYQVFVNGAANVDAGTNRTAVVSGLSSETTYNITVKARDFYGPNVSEPSNTLAVTTSAVSAQDTEAPTAPGDLVVYDFGSGEVQLFWTQSFDNQTAQAGIVYEVYVDGVLTDTVLGDDQRIVYGTGNAENTFTLIAVDGQGNRSAPVSVTILLQ